MTIILLGLPEGEFLAFATGNGRYRDVETPTPAAAAAEEIRNVRRAIFIIVQGVVKFNRFEIQQYGLAQVPR
jgi:hypothetical protein